MATFDVESLFTNNPLNDAINICLCGHMMWSHYSPTSLLMMLLIFVYETYYDESLFTNIPLNEAINICLWRHIFVYDVESLFTNIPLNDAINICLWRHMMLSHYSPTSLLMKLLIFVYDDIWWRFIIHQHPS